MGIKAQRVLTQRKDNTAFTIINSGSVTFPPTDSIAVISLLEGNDVNRFADIERAMHDAYEFIRDNNRYGSPSGVAFVRNLDDAKRDVVERVISSSIVTGDVGVMLIGNIREGGNTTIVESAFRQLIDYAREQGRLGE